MITRSREYTRDEYLAAIDRAIDGPRINAQKWFLRAMAIAVLMLTIFLGNGILSAIQATAWYVESRLLGYSNVAASIETTDFINDIFSGLGYSEEMARQFQRAHYNYWLPLYEAEIEAELLAESEVQAMFFDQMLDSDPIITFEDEARALGNRRREAGLTPLNHEQAEKAILTELRLVNLIREDWHCELTVNDVVECRDYPEY